MLDEYRRWLESELALLGNASHHAYAFGQANMAKRAIEKLDEVLADNVVLVLSKGEATDALEHPETLIAKIREAAGKP